MMSLSARREMLISIRQRYLESSWTEKGRILDGFIATTGYDRKYAISLLRKKAGATGSVQAKSRPGAQVYDEQFRQVLLYIWYTANQVCSKRLVPFLPDLVAAMERHGQPIFGRGAEDIQNGSYAFRYLCIMVSIYIQSLLTP